MARIEIRVKLESVYSYEADAYGYGNRTEIRYIYRMADENGKVYVWKTNNSLCFESKELNDDGMPKIIETVNKGAEIVIKATVKGRIEYKGEQQTQINRVKVIEIISNGKSWEEIQAEREAAKEAKRAEQLASVKDGDFVWAMPYRQYKDHYADCETLCDSYNKREREITVIIREGRLKNSGVRGKHYSGYKLKGTSGKFVTYRAICEENAIKRAVKEFGGEWECVRVYDYSRDQWW